MIFRFLLVPLPSDLYGKNDGGVLRVPESTGTVRAGLSKNLPGLRCNRRSTTRAVHIVGASRRSVERPVKGVVSVHLLGEIKLEVSDAMGPR